MPRIQWTLGKHFLPPAGCGSILPAKSLQDAWSGRWLVRGQMKMEDEVKHCSPICSTLEAFIVRYIAWSCGEKLGPFCWPMLAPGIAVLVHLLDLLSILLRCCGFPRIWKAVLDQGSSRSPKLPWPFFVVVQVCLWEVLWSFFSVQPLTWSSPVVIKKSTFCHMSQSDWEMVHCFSVE